MVKPSCLCCIVVSPYDDLLKLFQSIEKVEDRYEILKIVSEIPQEIEVEESHKKTDEGKYEKIELNIAKIQPDRPKKAKK